MLEKELRIAGKTGPIGGRIRETPKARNDSGEIGIKFVEIAVESDFLQKSRAEKDESR